MFFIVLCGIHDDHCSVVVAHGCELMEYGNVAFLQHAHLYVAELDSTLNYVTHN